MGRFPITRRELLVLLAILALASLMRLPGLDERGAWDADQGTHMLALRAMVVDGLLPLLGPSASTGEIHHGALYYYLLAPSALVSSADPMAVAVQFALMGIAAVAATWWLGRLIGGPTAGLLAGLLLAVSPVAIAASVFIWNPNPIPLFAALAYGSAIRAWQTRRPAWWLGAAAGAVMVSQLHVVGIIVLPPLVAVYAADLARRSRAPGDSVRPVLMAGLGAVLIAILGFTPLLAHEFTTGFSEVEALRAYLAGGASGSPAPTDGQLARTMTVGLRTIAWPFAGLVTDQPVAALIAVELFALLAGVAALVRLPGRRAAWWLLATVAWSVVALSMLTPGLLVVIPELPSDHYHAFLDPLLIAVAGLGLARMFGWRTGRGRAAIVRLLAGAALVLLLAIEVSAWPPSVAPSGTWPMAEAAAIRVRAIAESVDPGAEATVILDGIPAWKPTDGIGFPLVRHGVRALAPDAPAAADASMLVLECDPLFEDVVGAACGGQAEDAWLASAHGHAARTWQLLDRFEASPRRMISIYATTVIR